jgi:RND family efflux transporter MFP subunit
LHAVSQQDLSNARAALDMAQAQLNIKQKALDDTMLKAPFDGVLADRFIDLNQFVQPRQSILNLQDVSHVDIQVFAPEGSVAAIPRDELDAPRKELKVEAVFDFLPNVAFPVTFKEFSTEADPVTQTYRVVLTMPSPEEYSILPGMGGTIRVRVTAPADVTKDGFRLPLDAVPVDSATGKYSVWILKTADEGLATVHKQPVEVASVMGDSILVRSGLAMNDRIALAGVHLLKEGQKVRPFDATNKTESN